MVLKYYLFVYRYLNERSIRHQWKSTKIGSLINPTSPSVSIWHRLAKLSILILEGIIKKFSYERRDYESVDEKSQS